MRPACPHCGHTLTKSEIGTFFSLLRQTYGGGRPIGATGKRTKPRAYEAMPIILTMLQHNPIERSLAEIHEVVRDKLVQRGYQEKKRATSWGLNYLQKLGLVRNSGWGRWTITSKGLKTNLDEETAHKLERGIEW